MLSGEQRLTSVETIALMITHEIKNPLSLIKANLDYIEFCDTNKVFLRNYEVMRNGINKANNMITDFVHLLKSPCNEISKVDVFSIIDDIINNYKASLPLINVRFNFKHDKPQFVLGNKTLLSLLFSNILKNAVEAIEAIEETGQIRKGIINIKYETLEDELILKIEDNGIGISSETLEKINENLYYTTKKTGSGIGIEICRKIVEEHNGKFNIESSKNSQSGCVVTVCLKLLANNF